MFKKAKELFFYADTPFHPGSGTGLGSIDLPIQRERHTQYPLIQSSSIKGIFRVLASEKNIKQKLGEEFGVNDEEIESYISLVFGPERGYEHAGSLSFVDAQVLFFPVRSLRGVFAWVTSPDVLSRFKKLVEEVGNLKVPTFPFVNQGEALVTENSVLICANSRIVLEEYAFTVKKDGGLNELANWFAEQFFPSGYDYWKKKFPQSVVILNDMDYQGFVQISTQVIARIKMDYEKGTAKTGGLWYEEHLPPDTIIYTLALATDTRGEQRKDADWVISFLSKLVECSGRRVQMGGDETTGKGLISVIMKP